MVRSGQRCGPKCASFLLAASSAVALVATWTGGRFLIPRAYRGQSIDIVNSIITGQAEHSLAEYLTEFNRLMTFFALLLVWSTVLAIHFALIRLANRNSGISQLAPESNRRLKWLGTVGVYATLILASLYQLIVAHGNTYLSTMIHDTFVYFDGAYRVSAGQVPHRDFHTPLGLASYYLPYWGTLIAKGFAGSIEAASFLVAFALLATAFVLLSNRLKPLPSIVTIASLGFLVMAPLNAGDTGASITHAMFYNRWGWAGLTVVMLSFITPDEQSSRALAIETALISSVIVFLFYLKLTYFLVAVAFLPILATASAAQARLAVTVTLATATLLLAGELSLGLSAAYFEDINQAIAASGLVRRDFSSSFLDNAFQYFLILLALIHLFLCKTLDWRGLTFSIFVGASGLAILDQNAQRYNVVTLVAILLWAVAAAAPATGHRSAPVSARCRDPGVLTILLIIFVSVPLIPQIRGALTFYWHASRGPAQLEPAQPSALNGLIVGEIGSTGVATLAKEGVSMLAGVQEQSDPITLFNLVRSQMPRQPLYQREYMETVIDGLALLRSQKLQPSRILTLDLANPFNFLATARPATGDFSWFHEGRNFSKNSHPSPARLFRDVDLIMVPKFPLEYPTNRELVDIYGGYISEHYAILAESQYWTIRSRSEVAPPDA
jgi:hypothetical protein